MLGDVVFLNLCFGVFLRFHLRLVIYNFRQMSQQIIIVWNNVIEKCFILFYLLGRKL